MTRNHTSLDHMNAHLHGDGSTCYALPCPKNCSLPHVGNRVQLDSRPSKPSATTRCGSRLVLAMKHDRCRRPRRHTGNHQWWSTDGRVIVTWARNAGGSRWRYPLKQAV